MAFLALPTTAAHQADLPATPVIGADEPTHEVGFRKWLITLTAITCALLELIDTSIGCLPASKSGLERGALASLE